MPIYEMREDSLDALSPTSFAKVRVAERHDIQRLLRERIDAISPDTLIISEEFDAWEDSRRRVDLLGIDKQANLVVIELKRDNDGGHMELQAIRYAAMVSTMTFAKAVQVYEDYLGSDDGEDRLLDFLGWSEPDEDRFGQDVSIVLAAADFSVEITTAVLWLNERDLNIRCVRLQPYVFDDHRLLIDIQPIVPLPEAADFQVRLKDKARAERAARGESPWTGVWYCNVGESPTSPRDWNLCVKHGYLSAGHGLNYIKQLRHLKQGDPVVAYQKGHGYVGYGIVAEGSCEVDHFRTDDGRLLSDVVPGLHYGDEPAEMREHAVRIDWRKSVAIEDAVKFDEMFANQNIVCKLRHRPTLDRLREVFGIKEPFRTGQASSTA
ncbi:MAG: hypothetical protein AAF266_11090 [Planctomycetota bacterium]